MESLAHWRYLLQGFGSKKKSREITVGRQSVTDIDGDALVRTLPSRLSPMPPPLEIRRCKFSLVCARIQKHLNLQQSHIYSQTDRNPPPSICHMRPDGRDSKQLRPMACETKTISMLDGSARYSHHGSCVLASVTGPIEAASNKQGERAHIQVTNPCSSLAQRRI